MRTLFIVSSALVFGHAFAQEVATSDPMKALEPMVGKWEGDIKIYMAGPDNPATAKTVVNVTTFGSYQETIYTMDIPGMGKFTGHQFVSWDALSKSYKGWNFDTQAPTPRNETGHFEGKKFIMVSDPQGGMITRITFDLGHKEGVGFLLEAKQGDEFVKMGEGIYKKAK